MTQRNSSLPADELLHFVVHEIKAPLTVILGNARWLCRNWRASPSQERESSLQELQREAERIDLLLRNLAVLSSVSRVEAEPVLLNHFLARFVESSCRRLPDLLVSFKVPSPSPVVRGNEALLAIVLENLIMNSHKYALSGGAVDLSATTRAGRCILSVRDYGAGIHPSELDLIFDLFYRSGSLSSSTPGSGIGLAVCRRLVEAMGGRITAALPERRGLEVRVLLDLYEDDNDA
jgi:two-component system, OmpR family, sensor histidine kinase KdpD